MASDRDRQRACRARREGGRCFIRVEVQWDELVDMLTRHGLLGAWDENDLAAVEAATARALRVLADEPVTP